MKKRITTLLSILLVVAVSLTALPLQVFAGDKKTENVRYEIYKNKGNAFFIKNRKTGKYLDVQGGKAKNGANIHQWEFTGNKNQQWRMIEVDYQLYKIVSELDWNYAIDVAGKSGKDGANVQLYKSGQTFETANHGDNAVINAYYTIRSTTSEGVKGLTLASDSTKNGVNVQQESVPNRRTRSLKPSINLWDFELVDKTNADKKPKYTKITPSYRSNYVYIKNAITGKYLAVDGNTTKNKTNIVQQNFNGKKNQRFMLAYRNLENYGIISGLDEPKDPKGIVEVYKESKQKDANVLLKETPESEPYALHRYWTFRRQKDGTYKIYNLKSDLGLSIANGSKAHGASVVQGASHNSWIIEAPTKELPKVSNGLNKYPNRTMKDIDTKMYRDYAKKYGESLGLEFEETIKKGYGTYDTPNRIYPSMSEHYIKTSIREELDHIKYEENDYFGVWFENGTREWTDGSTAPMLLMYFGTGMHSDHTNDHLLWKGD